MMMGTLWPVEEGHSCNYSLLSSLWFLKSGISPCGVLGDNFHAVSFGGRFARGAAERCRKASTDLVADESVQFAPICCTGLAWQCEHYRKCQKRDHLGRAQITSGVPRSTRTRLCWKPVLDWSHFQPSLCEGAGKKEADPDFQMYACPSW